MSLIVDFLLLAASGAACFFCWVLNKRLKSLTSTKDGLHTGIAALSQSAEDMQSAMSETKTLAGEQAERLQTLIDDASARADALEALLGRLSDISMQSVDDSEKAARRLIDLMTPRIREARVSAQLLLTALEETETKAPDLAAAAREQVETEQSGQETGNVSKDTSQREASETDGEDVEFVEIDIDDDETNGDEVKVEGEAA